MLLKSTRTKLLNPTHALLWVFFAFIFSVGVGGANSAEFRLAKVYKHDAYFVNLLRLALNNHPKKHRLEVIDVSIGQARLVRATASGSGDWNIIYTGYTEARRRQLLQIDVPLTKGLLGFRLLAIRKDRQDHFDSLSGIEEFKAKVVLGANSAWLDTDIMRHFGLSVTTAPTGSLYPMLAQGRFDALSRGANEILSEIEELNQNGEAAFKIEDRFVFAYRLDTFFYVSRQSRDLANIVETGLKNAIANGEFDSFFLSQPNIAEGLDQIAQRAQVIRFSGSVHNQSLESIPAEYWLGAGILFRKNR